MPCLEITEVLLVHSNIVSNDYQHDSRDLYTSLHENCPNMGKYGPENSVFGHFSRSAFVSNNTKLDISSKTFIFLKTFNLEFLYIKVWFTDQNCKSLEIEDKINITLVLTRNWKNKGLTRNQIF